MCLSDRWRVEIDCEQEVKGGANTPWVDTREEQRAEGAFFPSWNRPGKEAKESGVDKRQHSSATWMHLMSRFYIQFSPVAPPPLQFEENSLNLINI